MTDDQVATLHRVVDQTLEEAARRRGEVLRRYEWVTNAQKFEQMFTVARGVVTTPAPEIEIRAVLTMCFLGPARNGIPPAELREAVRGIAQEVCRFDPESHDRVRDIVIAFGCGRWPGPGEGPWYGQWAEAKAAVDFLVECAIARVNPLLKHVVVGLKDADLEDPRPNMPRVVPWRIGTILTTPFNATLHLEQQGKLELRFQDGEGLVAVEQPGYVVRHHRPIGTRLVFSVGEGGIGRDWGNEDRFPSGTEFVITAQDDGFQIAPYCREEGDRKEIKGGGAKLCGDQVVHLLGPATIRSWSCYCGSKRCPKQHRLSSWNPEESLVHFITRAVVGA